MMVVQVAYIGLMSIDKLESLLYPIINLWPSNGFNKLALSKDKTPSALPPRISVIGYKSFFLLNFNLDFILIVLPLLVGLALFIYAKKRDDKPKRLRSYLIMKEYGMTMLLFAQLHLVVCIAIGIKYGMDQIYGVAIGGVLLVGLIAMTVLFWRRPKHFGEYKSYFDKTALKSNFYIVLIIFRFVLAVGLGMFNSNIAGITIAIAAVGLQLLCLVVFRPYVHNIRPILNSIVMLFTLAIYLNYRTHIVDETQWITSYLPLFLLIALLVCVIGNILMIIRDLFCERKGDEKERVKRDEYLGAMENTLNSEARRNLQLANENTVRALGSIRESLESTTMNMLRDIRMDIGVIKKKPVESAEMQEMR